MCSIFSSQPRHAYAHQTRSVRLGGHVTSIRLEGAFWIILEEIAQAQHMPLGRFLTKLHDEVLEVADDVHNFTSLLRCACLSYVSEVRGEEKQLVALRVEAGSSDVADLARKRLRPGDGELIDHDLLLRARNPQM